MSIQLLDCTLRDGGFINDWKFGHDQIVNLFERSVAAGIDIIEIGFIDERREYDVERTIMPDGRAVNDIFKGLNSGNSMVVGMIDYGTCSADKILPCAESFMDGIRVIFKKKDSHNALRFCAELMEKGYKLFVQPVSITSYSDEEMEALIKEVNKLKPYAVSMVDTYGLLHQGNLLHFFEIIDSNLDKDIIIGYHAHNNFQLGYSNAIALVEKNPDRNLCIDGSIYGMGKGAGNVPLELLCMYMNDFYDKSYDLNSILEALDSGIMEIYMKTPWGYSLKYFLAASNDCHPKYVQNLMTKRALSIKSINEILSSIDKKDKLTYNEEHIEKLYREYQEEKINDKSARERLKKALKGTKPLIIGPGKNIMLQKDRVEAYIKAKNPIVISINFDPEGYDSDYIFLSNSKRYVELSGRLTGDNQEYEIIATSNVTKITGEFDYTIDYNSLIDESLAISDSAFIMLLKLLIDLDIKECALAGFDGYVEGENFFNMSMEYAFVKNEPALLNRYTEEALKVLRKNICFEFVTDTAYKVIDDEKI